MQVVHLVAYTLHTHPNIETQNIQTYGHTNRREIRIAYVNCLSPNADFRVENMKNRIQEEGLYAVCLAETRWKGDGEYALGDGYVLLNSTCDEAGRGGVGILLSPCAAANWKSGGRSQERANVSCP